MIRHTQNTSITFKGRDPVSSKIAIDNKMIEQLNSFNKLGNLISYGKEVDVDRKLSTVV